MRRFIFWILLFIVVLPLASCAAPPTPTPTVDFRATEQAILSHVLATLTAAAPTPTRIPTATPTRTPTIVPSVTPTADFRATESSILSHVFATLTASAPTATPTASPTVTTTPTRFRLNMDAIFPPNPAREVLFDNCMGCHTFLPLMQQKTEEQWRGTLTNHRTRYVSKLPLPYLESLIGYMAEHFNPDKPLPEPPPEADWRTWPAY
ncbi:MAG: hypothetical protein HY782_10350 [Chloroflexi bacterium]|nr:hypothetical protein [Chloroflexota bacterium]